MQVAVFHPGTQHSWQTARALQDIGRLEWYATSIFYQPDRWPYLLERLPGPLGRRLHRDFSRFRAQGLDPALVRTSGIDEWLERIAARAGLRGLARRIDAAGNRRFGRALESAIASDYPFALWGYDASSRDAFEMARRRGRRCILDRTIGHSRAQEIILAQVREQWPQWFEGSGPAILAGALDREEAEYALADVILAGSETAAATIRAHAQSDVSAKLRVLPYCFDEALFGTQPEPRPVRADEPVRFLFIGQLGPRKGLHLLLEAFERLPTGKATLTLVGNLVAPRAAFARHAGRVTHIPHVPRAEVPRIMAEHHVLVFPSYFEGSALSLLEGLASGLALIQSRPAGNGVTPACGLLLDELSVDALTEAMRVALDDRELLDRWRSAAQVEAQSYTFARYRQNVAELLRDLEV